jgi:hypothetical protein
MTGPWQFFTHDEAAAIEAIIAQLIRASGHSPGPAAEQIITCKHSTKTVALRRTFSFKSADLLGVAIK